MQGMAAQAQEENNSSLIWGLVGSLRQGFSLHWTSAAALLPGPETVLPWPPAGVGAPGAVLHQCNRLRQLPSPWPAVWSPSLERLRALTLSSRPSPDATSSKKTSLTSTAVSSGAFYTQPWSQLLEHMLRPILRCTFPHISHLRYWVCCTVNGASWLRGQHSPFLAVHNTELCLTPATVSYLQKYGRRCSVCAGAPDPSS